MMKEVLDLKALDQLGRKELISRASDLGVDRAEKMTRPELKDEILRRTKSDSEKVEARGLFGLARAMLANVVEGGLNMPDAAALIRGTATFDAKVDTRTPVATVTLAEIYAAQGHTERALHMLDDVLTVEPDHAEARSLRERWGLTNSPSGSHEPGLVRPGIMSDASANYQPAGALETTGEEIESAVPPEVAFRVEAGPFVTAISQDGQNVALEATSVEGAGVEGMSVESLEPDERVVSMGGVSTSEVEAAERRVRADLKLEFEGTYLWCRYTLGTDWSAIAGGESSPTLILWVIGFKSQHGSVEKVEARAVLGDSELASGSFFFEGFALATIRAALGFEKEGQFISLVQTKLARTRSVEG